MKEFNMLEVTDFNEDSLFEALSSQLEPMETLNIYNFTNKSFWAIIVKKNNKIEEIKVARSCLDFSNTKIISIWLETADIKEKGNFYLKSLKDVIKEENVISEIANFLN